VDTKDELLQAYLVGNRLETFLTDVLPQHPEYEEKETQEQLETVQLYLEKMALLIDQQAYQDYILSVLMQKTTTSIHNDVTNNTTLTTTTDMLDVFMEGNSLVETNTTHEEEEEEEDTESFTPQETETTPAPYDETPRIANKQVGSTRTSKEEDDDTLDFSVTSSLFPVAAEPRLAEQGGVYRNHRLSKPRTRLAEKGAVPKHRFLPKEPVLELEPFEIHRPDETFDPFQLQTTQSRNPSPCGVWELPFAVTPSPPKKEESHKRAIDRDDDVYFDDDEESMVLVTRRLSLAPFRNCVRCLLD
jgi:hypothetical protein